MNNGYVQLRRGIFEHIEEGKLTWRQAHVYIDLIALANPSTGIWRGSAGYLETLFGEKKRTIKDCLQSLEEKGYIKRFMIPGNRYNYPILVNKYVCSLGALRNKRLNATKTVDWRYPVYDNGPDDVPVDVPLDVPVGARNNNRELRLENIKSPQEENFQETLERLEKFIHKGSNAKFTKL